MIVVTLKAETMHCDEAKQMSVGKVAQSRVDFSHGDDGDGVGTAVGDGVGILDWWGPRGNFGSLWRQFDQGVFRTPGLSLATKNFQGGCSNFGGNPSSEILAFF